MDMLPLLSGSYAPDQAREILDNLIRCELQFHRLQDFRSLIRYEGNCEQAAANIRSLRQTQLETDRLLRAARDGNLHLRIEASIRIELAEAPEEMPALAPCPGA